jgi:ATP-dependent RNA helicase DeaD
VTQFETYGLDPAILQALQQMGFEKPSPIQEATIPLVLQGEDLIALAQTGSGKTAACAIPICHRVDTQNLHVQALIIVPTRELALQYATETQKIGGRKGVKAFALYGGEDQSLQEAKLRSGVQVLIATPGRLIDLIYQRVIDLSHVDTLILDEADEMLSMGFVEDLEFIIHCLVHEHQTLLFSATMPKDIRRIAQQHMKQPKEISLVSEVAGPETLEHRFVYCSHGGSRPKVLVSLISEFEPKQSLIFCQSRHQVEEVHRFLKGKFPATDFLHGGLNQELRTIITNKFRSGRIRHLVVTDVAGRGLDFSGVTHVFIYQLSSDIDAYVHRAGRTGRSGREGVATSLVTSRELGILREVLKRIKRNPIWIGSPPPPPPAPRRR